MSKSQYNLEYLRYVLMNQSAIAELFQQMEEHTGGDDQFMLEAYCAYMGLQGHLFDTFSNGTIFGEEFNILWCLTFSPEEANEEGRSGAWSRLINLTRGFRSGHDIAESLDCVRMMCFRLAPAARTLLFSALCLLNPPEAVQHGRYR